MRAGETIQQDHGFVTASTQGSIVDSGDHPIGTLIMAGSNPTATLVFNGSKSFGVEIDDGAAAKQLSCSLDTYECNQAVGDVAPEYPNLENLLENLTFETARIFGCEPHHTLYPDTSFQ